ncbi:hypothetical protein A9995_01415 [Erythrobacter sp. QSSC1-22B]|uniref:hypothetical protein n=1 Tax=Erythrobacter sp. QSSC1-22B TaxID=1860125 RepID=UPI000805ECEB|nr:hypothetical protein [Erythrobacter sp. QSSC1-22B]OBX20406.1 hypothetical protein A9995_01415 [Erythrobacter sp. QSSC1-22B]
MRLASTVSVLALASALPLSAPVSAQDMAVQDMPQAPAPEVQNNDPQADAPMVGNEIVVTGARQRGALDVEQPPVLELDAEDIAALGAGSIDDLLQAIEPATGSARGRGGGGRPIFLVNGVRIGSFREFRSYPPEAIEKVEVFPEEVAQRFGYSPDRRVVNFILKNNFSSREIELEYGQPGIGGYSQNEQEFSLLTISDGARINFNLEFEDTSLLTEAERDLPLIDGSPGGVAGGPDPREFRSLVADSAGIEASANYAKAFIDSGSSISLNVTGAYNERRSLSGLDTVLLTDPLERNIASNSLASSGSYNRPLGEGWNLTATFDASRANSRTRIDRRAGGGVDTARSTLWGTSTLATVTGSPVYLPAGDVATTFDVGYNWNRISSTDTRSAQDSRLTRGDLSAGINVVVPLTSRREGFADAIGSISLTGQAGINELSDFGTLTDWSLGLNWQPFERLNLSATRIWREVAPGLNALGDPQVVDFNVPVFDFTTGESVLATVVTGGNPALVAETQADWKFSANWDLPFIENTRLQLDYAINRSNDVTSSAPGLSPAFEAAFPDRVTRDGAGQLIALDRRPITLIETRSKVLSFGINTSGRIGAEPEVPDSPPAGAANRGGRGPGAAGGPGGATITMGREGMEAMRTRFCATPVGETPDLTGLPEALLERLRGPDGTIPPERIAQLRERFCGAEVERGGERMEAMRAAVCADPPNLEGLPEEMLARLRNEAGEIDPDRLAQLRERLCSADGAAAGEGGAAAQPGRRRGGGGGIPGMGGGENPDTRPRYFLSLTHNFALENEVIVGTNGPVLDQRDGFVLGGGGVPVYSARLEGGLFWQGYGMRVSGNYVGGSELRGGELPGSTDLFFGDLATFDLRLFADLGEVTGAESGVFDGLRVSLNVDNIFDARRNVVDANGVTPLAYDPLRIDPTGRYLGIELRKLF